MREWFNLVEAEDVKAVWKDEIFGRTNSSVANGVVNRSKTLPRKVAKKYVKQLPSVDVLCALAALRAIYSFSLTDPSWTENSGGAKALFVHLFQETRIDTLLHQPCSILKTCRNVFRFEIRIVCKNPLRGMSSGQQAQYGADRHPHSADTRLAAQYGRIETDSFKLSHGRRSVAFA